MSDATVAFAGMSEAEHRAQLRRALIASTVGTAIEWYDFLLYGTVSALVFGPLFFPKYARISRPPCAWKALLAWR